MGRKSTFTPEIAAAICERLAAGESLRAICRDEGMPSEALVRKYAIDDTAFAAQYAQARDQGLDVLADEIIDISNTPVVGTKSVSKPTGVEVSEGDMIDHRRLQIDARKWYLSKLAPKRYGDRLAVEHSGKVELASTIVNARRRTGSNEPGSDLC